MKTTNTLLQALVKNAYFATLAETIAAASSLVYIPASQANNWESWNSTPMAYNQTMLASYTWGGLTVEISVYRNADGYYKLISVGNLTL